MTDEDNRDVVVLGGGISGLTAAWHLSSAGVDVCLLEAEKTVGGCTRTERRDGFLLEKGPFNVIVREPSFERLLEELSERVQVVPASRAARKRYIYRRGCLVPVPSNPLALLTTPLLSIGGRCRLIGGLFSSPRPRRDEETIEEAAARRFGHETADTIVSAAISGILAGDIRRLSLSACFPAVGRIDREARSLIGYGLKSAFRPKDKTVPRRKRRWRGLVSIEGGLGALTGELGDALGADLVTGWRAASIRRNGANWELDRSRNVECGMSNVECGEPNANRQSIPTGVGNNRHSTIRCRRLVLAVSAPEAARLLSPLAPQAAEEIAGIESASLVILNLGFDRTAVSHPLEGFGFLVPHNESDFPLMGTLFADSVFPHHAPPDCRLLRVFIGGSNDNGAVNRSDEELLTTATDALGDLLAIKGAPILVDICRYPSAIPQYHLGHLERVSRIRTAVADQPDLYLIGNYLDGISLSDCVRSATELAQNMLTRDFVA